MTSPFPAPGAAPWTLMKANVTASGNIGVLGLPSRTVYNLVTGSTFLAHPDDVQGFRDGGSASIVAGGSTSSVPGQLILMRHPDGRGCSWGGKTYTVDGSQRVAVPFEAAADLQSLGFVAVGQVSAP